MQITMKIDYRNGKHAEGLLSGREYIPFEAWNGGVGLPAWAQEPTMTGIYMLGYLLVKTMHKDGTHDGPIAPTFDGFVDAVEDVNMEMEEDGVPLDVAPTSSG